MLWLLQLPTTVQWSQQEAGCPEAQPSRPTATLRCGPSSATHFPERHPSGRPGTNYWGRVSDTFRLVQHRHTNTSAQPGRVAMDCQRRFQSLIPNERVPRSADDLLPNTQVKKNQGESPAPERTSLCKAVINCRMGFHSLCFQGSNFQCRRETMTHGVPLFQMPHLVEQGGGKGEAGWPRRGSYPSIPSNALSADLQQITPPPCVVHPAPGRS